MQQSLPKPSLNYAAQLGQRAERSLQGQASWSVLSLVCTAGALLLLLLSLSYSPLSAQVLATISGLSLTPQWLALFLAGYGGAFLLRAWAWRVLLGRNGGQTLHLLAILHISLLANHLFPIKVGEPLRIVLLAGRGIALPIAVSTTVLARLLDLGAVLGLALVATALLTGLDSPQVALLGGVTGIAAVAALGGALLLSRLGRFQRLMSILMDFAKGLETPRVALAWALVLPSWVLEGTVLWVVAQAGGVPLAFEAAVAVTAFTILFQTVQVTPGGLGVYEVAQAGGLTLFGVDPTVALALALSTHGLKFVYSYATGAVGCAFEGGAFALLGQLVPRAASGRLPWAQELLQRWRTSSLPLSRYVDHGILVALVAALIAALPEHGWTLLPGLAATLPLALLGKTHHLPLRALPVLLLVPLAFVALFGVFSLTASGIALGLGIAGALAMGPRTAVGATLVGALWPTLTTQSILLGASRPGEALLFGMAALAAIVLLRQWWLSYHPLPSAAPLPAGNEVAVVIPALNEAAAVGWVVSGVPRAALSAMGYRVRVIVVDDGSTDDTGVVARAAGADVVVRHETRQGVGAALRTGLTAAQHGGAGAVVYLDGDGEYDPADMVAVLEPVLHGDADYVLGSRFPGANGVMCWSRKLGNRAFTLLLSLLTGKRLQDGQTGYRAFSARALAQAEIRHDYNYAQVLTLDLLRKGMRLSQTPVSYRLRSQGRSFIRYREYLRRVVPAMAQELLEP